MYPSRDYITKLEKAVADGGRGARDWIETEARASDELELTSVCYTALAGWGRDGLELIVQIAINGTTVKSKSAALTVLAHLAVHGEVSETGFFAVSSLSKAVNERLSELHIRGEARQALRLLVLSLPTDDLLIPLSQSFLHLSLVNADMAEELVTSIATKWFKVGPPLLDRFEAMLATHANDEPKFQKLFCEFPQLLDPMAVQAWSQPDFHGAFEPDFVIRRADDTYVVIEIECPGKKLMTKAGRVGHDATHAETQALEYEDFLASRIAEAAAHFPNYRRADCLAVVGLERSLDTEQRSGLERANSRKLNSKIVGFDWLLERAKAVVTNVGEGNVEVINRHRVI